MKKFLTVFAFCFLIFAFSFAPARAQLDCGDYGFEENGCCNYGDANQNPYHITRTDERCNSNWCERESFNDPTFPYTDCNYCHKDNLCMRKDSAGGCAGICDNVCCATPNGDDDDEICPLPDYETDPCCPLAEVGFLSNISLPDEILDLILNLKAAVVFRGDELKHAHVENLTERYFGTPGEDFDDGVVKKLTPPNSIFIKDEAERQRIHNEYGAWGFKTKGMEGNAGKVMGADKHLYEFDWATTSLYSYLTKTPDQENIAFSLEEIDESLCQPERIEVDLASALAQVPGQESVQGSVLAVEDEDLCHEVLPGPKHGACVAQASADISTAQALRNLLGRSVKIYPGFSFLQKIFFSTLGRGTEGEPAGFFRIFDLPDEEHEKLDGETEKGSFGIQLSIPLPAGLQIDLPPINVDADMEGVWNTGTEANADEGIKQKLSVPQAEDGATAYRSPETSVVLASTKTPLDGYAPLGPLAPLNTSFAERLGRTLGTWLGKLIML